MYWRIEVGEAQHIVAVADATKHTATIKRFAMQIDNVALIESVYRTIELYKQRWCVLALNKNASFFITRKMFNQSNSFTH